MITNVTARYMRKVQIRDYEPHEAEATIVGVVGDGEDANTIIGECMSKARGIVLGALGLAQPVSREPAGAALSTSDTKAVDPTGGAPEEAKRGPGRPRKDKAPEIIPATDAEKAAAATREAGAKPAEVKDPASMDDLKPPAFLDKSKPAEAKADAASMDEFEKTAVVEPIKISEAELQRVAAETAQRLGSPAAVKELMAKNYKIARLGELREDLRKAFIDDLKALKAKS